MLNKRAQVGETMTWVFATLIIIVILSISIYAATFLAKTRIVSYADTSFLAKSNLKLNDIILDNSLFAYFNSPEKFKKGIFNNLKEMSLEGKFYSDFDKRFKHFKGGIKNG